MGNTSRNRQKEWQDLREKMQTEMETFAKRRRGRFQAFWNGSGLRTENVMIAKEFLRKFSVLKEEMQVDPDSLIIFLHIRAGHYGNMPLIEPLEIKRSPKIEDFVIVD